MVEGKKGIDVEVTVPISKKTVGFFMLSLDLETNLWRGLNAETVVESRTMAVRRTCNMLSS